MKNQTYSALNISKKLIHVRLTLSTALHCFIFLVERYFIVYVEMRELKSLQYQLTHSDTFELKN